MFLHDKEGNRWELDLTESGLMTISDHLATMKEKDEQIAALKAEIAEIGGKLRGEQIRNHDIGEQIDTLIAGNSVLREQNSAMDESLVKLRLEVEKYREALEDKDETLRQSWDHKDDYGKQIFTLKAALAETQEMIAHLVAFVPMTEKKGLLNWLAERKENL